MTALLGSDNSEGIDMQPLIEDSITPESQERQSRIARAGRFIASLSSRTRDGILRAAVSVQLAPHHYAKRTAQTGIVAAEISPANEIVRYGALAYALEKTSGGAAIGALALGISTFTVETPAALSTASLLQTEKSNKTLNKVNGFIDDRFGRNFKMNPAVEAGVAMTGGSAVVLVEKHREDQTRTLQQNRKHGLFTAGWMSAYFTVEGAFIGANSTEGNVLNAQTIGATLLAVGATAAGTKIALRTRNKENVPPQHKAEREKS
jgi:hypothetical protein